MPKGQKSSAPVGWAYISCRRAGLSYTRSGSSSLTDGPILSGAEYLASPLRKSRVFIFVRSFDRGIEPRAFGREWREGDGFAVGRPLPLDHLPWLLACDGCLNGLACWFVCGGARGRGR